MAGIQSIVLAAQDLEEQTIEDDPVLGHPGQLPGNAIDPVLEVGEVQFHVSAWQSVIRISAMVPEIVSNVTILVI